MTIELCCGQCNGRISVETHFDTAVCPHCGANLRATNVDSVPADSIHSPPHQDFAHLEQDAVARISTETIIVKGSAVPFLDESKSIAPFSLHQKVNEQLPETPDSEVNAIRLRLREETQSGRTHDTTEAESKSDFRTDDSNIHVESDTSGSSVGFDRDNFSRILPLSTLVNPLPQQEAALPTEIHDRSPSLTSSVPTSTNEPDFSWMSDQKYSIASAPSPGFSLNLNAATEPPADSIENSDQLLASRQPTQAATAVPASLFEPVTASASDGAGHAHFEAFSARELNVRPPSQQKPVSWPSSMVMLLLILGSYASLLTIYVVYLSLIGRRSQLESLPDLKTVQQLGGRAIVPRPENVLPPGHDLQLGQTQRYGNIKTTPLRVTRGPIAFSHFTEDPKKERAVSGPVLKLWIKFENVSTDQTIAPLDTTLMFFRRIVDNHVASYNAIFPAFDRTQDTTHYPFDRIAEDSEWRVVGQQTNKELAPHQSFETFIPSEENVDDLSGEIIWRVHFRKGFGPKSGNGVTTLIDVHFQSDQIVADAA